MTASSRGRGIGMKALDFAHRKLEAHDRPTLTVLGKNTRAIALYRRMGWRVIGKARIFDPKTDETVVKYNELLVMEYAGQNEPKA